uniref:ORF61 n=1 Tax=Cydia pomonella granulosis virus TaxID=28289 RepID=A0A5B8H8Z2_GVCP|nr:ORF61 [Cydia pomonella granulovirus]
MLTTTKKSTSDQQDCRLNLCKRFTTLVYIVHNFGAIHKFGYKDTSLVLRQDFAEKKFLAKISGKKADSSV